jgi:t-SNARE complex subunit (syntaxin)
MTEQAKTETYEQKEILNLIEGHVNEADKNITKAGKEIVKAKKDEIKTKKCLFYIYGLIILFVLIFIYLIYSIIKSSKKK